MGLLPLYIFVAAILHVAEEYYYPGGFLNWAKEKFPLVEKRLTVKFALIVNSLFLLLCASGILFGGNYPEFALSIAGLVLVNAAHHILSSIFTLSYSPGLITSVILYLPVSIYSFVNLKLSPEEILTFILSGILYHLIVPVILFAPFNKPEIS